MDRCSVVLPRPWLGHGCGGGGRFCCRLSSGALPQCPHDPCRSCGCPHRRACAGYRCPQAAPGVRMSGPSVSAGRADLSWLTSADEQARSARPPTPGWDGDCGVPRSPAVASRRSPPRTSRPVGVRVAAEPDTRPRPLSAAASGTAPGVRTAAGDRGHRGQSYRNSSPGRRPLVGCRHGRDVWPTWRASRSRSTARAKAMAGRSKARASSAVSPP
jgi:hypothetical protein